MAPRVLEEDLKFTDSHEWARIEENKATFGISDYGQRQLGDINYVELPQVGHKVSQGKIFGMVEGLARTSETKAPVSGTVVEVNEDLKKFPVLMNTDPYEEGWMIKVEMIQGEDSEVEKLMDPEEYSKFCQEDAAATNQ